MLNFNHSANRHAEGSADAHRVAIVRQPSLGVRCLLSVSAVGMLVAGPAAAADSSDRSLVATPDSQVAQRDHRSGRGHVWRVRMNTMARQRADQGDDASVRGVMRKLEKPGPAVPEPGAAILFGLGLTSVAFGARRRSAIARAAAQADRASTNRG